MLLKHLAKRGIKKWYSNWTKLYIWGTDKCFTEFYKRYKAEDCTLLLSVAFDVLIFATDMNKDLEMISELENQRKMNFISDSSEQVPRINF